MATATRTKKVIKTVWYGFVQTYPDPAESTRKGVSCSVSAETLSDLFQNIFRLGTFYLSLGYRVTVEGLRETCAACNGNGEIRYWKKGHGWIYKQCPECKGVAKFGAIADFDLMPSESVKISEK